MDLDQKNDKLIALRNIFPKLWGTLSFLPFKRESLMKHF